MSNNKKISTYQLAITALFSAIMCILGPLSIPIGPIPVSFTNFAVMLAVYVLGTKLGTISLCVYILLGAVGLPVFSGATGGIGKLLGPTGGFIIGFIPFAIIAGIWFTKFAGNDIKGKIIQGVGMFMGTVVLYGFGVVWFMISLSATFEKAMTACVLPFIIPDIIKIIVAIILGNAIKVRLIKAGFAK